MTADVQPRPSQPEQQVVPAVAVQQQHTAATQTDPVHVDCPHCCHLFPPKQASTAVDGNPSSWPPVTAENNHALTGRPSMPPAHGMAMPPPPPGHAMLDPRMLPLLPPHLLPPGMLPFLPPPPPLSSSSSSSAVPSNAAQGAPSNASAANDTAPSEPTTTATTGTGRRRGSGGGQGSGRSQRVRKPRILPGMESPPHSRPGTPATDDLDAQPTSPATATASSKKRRENLSKEVTEGLRTWLLEHKEYPYPNEREKRQLCHEFNLTMTQCNNWFINGRRRILGTAGMHSLSPAERGFRSKKRGGKQPGTATTGETAATSGMPTPPSASAGTPLVEGESLSMDETAGEMNLEPAKRRRVSQQQSDASEGAASSSNHGMQAMGGAGFMQAPFPPPYAPYPAPAVAFRPGPDGRPMAYYAFPQGFPSATPNGLSSATSSESQGMQQQQESLGLGNGMLPPGFGSNGYPPMGYPFQFSGGSTNAQPASPSSDKQEQPLLQEKLQEPQQQQGYPIPGELGSSRLQHEPQTHADDYLVDEE